MARKRRIVGLSEAMDGVLKKADPDGKRHGASAVVAWREVVGADIARHTKGFALREKRELVVFVDSPAWATQLSLMAPELIARLNSHLAQDAVRSVRFTVSRSVADEVGWSALEQEADEFYAPDPAEPIPLSENEHEQAVHIARAVREPALREVALRVMIKDLEYKKGERERTAQKGSEEPDSTT